jgi:predicted phage tail protein
MAEIDKKYMDKRFEIIAEKIGRFEKTLDLRTRDFDEIIKESLDSNYNVVKMIQEEVRNQNRKIESLQTRLSATGKTVNAKIGQAIRENLGDSRDTLDKVLNTVQKQEAKITAAAAAMENVGKEVAFETKQLDKRFKETFENNHEILKDLQSAQESQSTTVTSIHGRLEAIAKDIDYRLRQSEGNVKNITEDSQKTLKMMQEEVYSLKKSVDALAGNMLLIVAQRDSPSCRTVFKTRRTYRPAGS